MNLQRLAIFDNDKTLKENVTDSIKNIGDKPGRACAYFWLFWLQICVAVFILIMSILLPYFILYA